MTRIECSSFSKSRKRCIYIKIEDSQSVLIFFKKKKSEKIRKIFDQSDCAILKFRIWRQKVCQMKAYDPLISKLSLDLKSIKNFSGYSSLKIGISGFSKIFEEKKIFQVTHGCQPAKNTIK